MVSGGGNRTARFLYGPRRHAVPSGANFVGRMRLETSFAALSAPFVWSSSARVIVAVTPAVGAVLAAHAGRRGRPLGVIVHYLTGNAAVQSGTTSSQVAKMVGAAEYAALARANRVGVITRRFVPDLVAHGLAPDHITELPIASHVVAADLTPEQARRKLGWESRGLTVVHTGNMGMKQGLEHVMAAARVAVRRNMRIQFVLVGDGNRRAALEAEASNLPNLRFIDLVPEEDYPIVLAAADVLLLHERPGVTHMALPSKLTSYVAAQRPILAAVDDSGITKALLDSHRAAVTIPSGNTDALLDSLDRLRTDPQLVVDLVAGARKMGAAEFPQ